MALVPSGRIRVMEKQHFLPDALAQFNPQGMEGNDQQPATPAAGAAPQSRPNIEQEQVGGDASADPAQDEKQIAQPDTGSLIDAQDETQGQPHQEIGEGDDLQAAFEQILLQLGVEQRQIMSVRADIFKETVDLNNNTVKGYYLLPTYTKSGKVDKRKALQIAQQLGRKFNLQQKMENEPVKGSKGVVNWKIDFSTMPQVQLQQGGTSFDGMSGSQGGGGMGSPTSKAASTVGEMIKARREELYDTLRRIAQGE